MKSKFILGLGITLGVLSACDSDNDYNNEFDAVGDIYIRCQMIDNEVKYAPIYKAYSNMHMSDAAVSHTDEDSTPISLDKLGEDTSTFALFPSVDDYSKDDIKNGIYDFDLISTDSDTLKVSDKLLEERIDPIEITKFEFDKELHVIDLSWTTVENRDIYHVQIATEIDGQIVFSSTRLNDNKLSLKENTAGWDRNYSMKSGTTYTVSVSAYKFENSNTQSGYHINQESIEYREIEW